MLKKKFVITGKIKTITGLHIGAARESSEIGGMDNPVIKDPVSGLPYIPGSSLKGKMRSLLEKSVAKDEDFFNRNVGTKANPVRIHVCKTRDEAVNCPVCRLFGSSGWKEEGGKRETRPENHPSRVFFRDSHLTEEWAERFRSEVLLEEKYEASIDRITSAANPRPMERVPPGVEFEFEIVYNVEDDTWKDDIRNLFKAMKLLEDDYLGGSGSRGYGKVEFSIESISERGLDFYTGEGGENKLIEEKIGVDDVLNKIDEIFGGEN